jgi:EAL domain-containing protein (putative c-di-GMP-specific phosphodiesterase class I)
MVEAITKVAGALRIATIAERVETAEALERLRELGVDYAQGFHLARPEPLADLGKSAVNTPARRETP